MNKVAKLVIIDDADNYLLLIRSNHPSFGMDPDLPGGTMKDGESLLETMLREVKEEIGVVIDSTNVQQIYSGTRYSEYGIQYALFITKVATRPAIKMSWEHANYSWIDRREFLKKAISANDSYMHMVHDVVKAL